MMGSVDCIFSSDDIVVKPPNDKRLYRTIELHNGLCALLVNDPEIYPGGCPRHSNSEDEQEAGTGDEDGEEEEEFEDGEEEDDDEEEEEDEEDGDVDGKDEENGEIQPRRKGSSSQTKKAAAAMCVGMGSFSDPLGAQGLVHFLGTHVREWGIPHNYELGAYAGEKLMALGSQDSSAYALLSSVYTALGRLEDVERVKRMMRSRGVNKEPGCSWIELKDRVHVFVVGDQMHPQNKEVCDEVRILTKQMKDEGYQPSSETLPQLMTAKRNELDALKKAKLED